MSEAWNNFWEQARNADILAVAQSLSAKLKKYGSEFIGPCPACGGVDRFSVNTRKGIFNCRGFGGGDVIAMVAPAKSCTAIEAGERITGERRPDRSRDESPKERDARLERNVRLAAEAEARAEKQHAAEAEKARQTARLIKAYVRELGPVRGSPGERYLRVERKIDTDAIAEVLERVDALGWHPSVYFNEPGHPLHGQKLGAIIGVMTDPITALPTGAISRTYLDHQGRKVSKAKTLGSPAGIVRLSRDEHVLYGLYIAEGIETALAAMSKGVRPIWATGTTALMENFPVLPVIEWLTILVDHDANRAGEEAARACERRWRGAGREVRLRRPKQFGDFNDVLMRETQK